MSRKRLKSGFAFCCSRNCSISLAERLFFEARFLNTESGITEVIVSANSHLYFFCALDTLTLSKKRNNRKSFFIKNKAVLQSERPCTKVRKNYLKSERIKSAIN